MAAVQELEVAMRPKDGSSGDYLDSVKTQKALINDAINRNQTLSPNAKQTIKSLANRLGMGNGR